MLLHYTKKDSNLQKEYQEIHLLFEQSLHLLEGWTAGLAGMIRERRSLGFELLEIAIPKCSLAQSIGLLLRPIKMLKHSSFIHLKD